MTTSLGNRLSVGIPLAVGLVFTAAMLFVGIQTLAFLLHATRTEGRFAGAVAHTGGNHGGTFLYPEFAFRTADGRAFTYISKNGSTGQPYADGQAMPLLYDPDHPQNARLDTFFSLWTPTLVLAVFAFPLTLVPLGIIRSYLKRQP